MKGFSRLLPLFFFLSLGGVLTSCVSREDLYGSYLLPHSRGEMRKIYTPKYGMTFFVPDNRYYVKRKLEYREKKSLSKWKYEVKEYGLFLRVKRESGERENIFKLFGFVFGEHKRYILEYIPIRFFRYSRKITEEEMRSFLEKHKFTESL